MNANTRHDVANRLRSARAKVFPTAADAARALGMKPVTVRAHETGQNGVGYTELERYARRYGVSLTWLLTGIGGEEPNEATYNQVGVPLQVFSLVEDGAWLADEFNDYFPIRQPFAEDGQPEFAVYSDPRFPAEIVEAFKIVTSITNGPYLNGSIIFTIPLGQIGYRPGDHVLLVVEKGGFCQWTLREARQTQSALEYHALTSDSPPLTYKMEPDERVMVYSVVIGSITRRPVTNRLDPQDLRNIDHLTGDEEHPQFQRRPLPPRT